MAVEKGTSELVVGCGPYAKALAMILGAPVTARAIPPVQPKPRDAVILVLDDGDSPASAICLHREVLRWPGCDWSRWLIIAPNRSICLAIKAADMNGIPGGPNTFRACSRCIAVCTREKPLLELVHALSKLDPLSKVAFEGRLTSDSLIMRIRESLRNSKPTLQLRHSIRKLIHEAVSCGSEKSSRICWDSLCPSQSRFGNHHAYAHEIENWVEFASETPDVWVAKGLALLGPLSPVDDEEPSASVKTGTVYETECSETP